MDISNWECIIHGATIVNHELIKGAVYKIEVTASTVNVYENGTLLGTKSINSLPTVFKFWVGGSRSRMMEIKDFKVKSL